MNYRYTFPLYEEGETEEAKEYLINNMTSDTIEKQGLPLGIKILRTDEDGEESYVSSGEVPKDILKSLLKNIIEMTYGVNIVLMANCLKVQETIMGVYIPHLLRFLELSVLCKDVFTIQFNPISISTYAIIEKGMKNKQAVRWSPDTKWDDYILLGNKLSSDILLTNPINTFNNVNLNIELDDNLLNKFTNYLFKLGIIYNINDAKRISINLLPNYSYNKIIALTNAIHTYF